MLQAEDLNALGRLLVSICCQSLSAATPTVRRGTARRPEPRASQQRTQHPLHPLHTLQALAKSMAYISATFSPELHQLFMLLFSNPPATVHDVVMLCSGRMMTHMAQTQW